MVVVLAYMHLKNSTSLTVSLKLLLYLYISTFLVSKLKLMLILLQPAGSSPGGTESTSTRDVLVVAASQMSKSSGTA